MDLRETLALITVILWPAVPLFWIPVHGLSRIFKRLGVFTYIMPLVTWLPLACLIYLYREPLLRLKTDLPLGLGISGAVLLAAGTFLHLWTGKLLGIWGLIGLPEVSGKAKIRLLREGPFSLVRHPTYLAHTLMFSGIFLMTGSKVVGVLTALDCLLVNLIIIPLEERELLSRFGGDYEAYKKDVAWRFFPKIL